MNRRLASETLRDLASVSKEGPAGRISSVSGPPLLVAAQVVGEAQGITIRPPFGDVDARRRLQAIALASGVRTRTVILGGQWWVEENGPILAYKDANKAPVALVPIRPSLWGQLWNGSRYAMFDPADGSRTSVSPALAATLFPVASSFYRSFGDKRSTWDLIRDRLRLVNVTMPAVAAGLAFSFALDGTDVGRSWHSALLSERS